MLRQFSVNFAAFSLVLDMALTLFALKSAALLRPILSALPWSMPLADVNVPLFLYGVIPILWITAFLLSSVYDPKRIYKATDEFQQVTLAIITAALLFAGVLYLSHRSLSRWFFIIFLLLDISFLLGWRIIARFYFRVGRLPGQSRVLIVGAGDVGRRVGGMIQGQNWGGLHLIGYLGNGQQKTPGRTQVLGMVGEVRRVVEQRSINDVIIALPQQAYGQVNKLVLALHDLPVQVRVVPDYFSLALYRATVEDFGGLPMINLRDPALNDVQRLVKRAFDLTLGGVTTLLMVPVMGLIAVLIKLDSPGPVLFRQERVGENGRLFQMYKFRSMRVGAEKMQAEVNHINGNGELIHKQEDDPRVTRMGRFLRRASLDELPQLFNILKGDMSLVGPRPEMPWLVGRYEPWQHKRFAVPQGLTGWWQVNGRSDKPMHLHTEDDLYYVQNYSLWMDFYILLKTPGAVLRGKGAY